MKYLLIDTSNTFFRARHVTSKYMDTWDKLGFAIHVTLNAVQKCWRTFDADHVVFCLEGRSWRKDFYEPYKKNRAVARAALTETEQEEDRLFWEAYDDLTKFIQERSNCTVLRCPIAEADDMIARFIAKHPNDEHVIISSDTDFAQLLDTNVTQYNGISNEHITIEGTFDDKGKPVLDKKTGNQKQIGDPQYVLFEKCMRGDPTDNVFSAFPGVRKKGTKNKVGLVEAYADKHSKGFSWNNMMLQRWTDHNGQEHRVLDDYERNRTLIDLTAQPPEIQQYIDEIITEHSVPKNNKMVGGHFIRFCTKYQLEKINDYADNYVVFLNAAYKQEEIS